MADVSSPMFIRRLADKHPYAFPYGSAVLISVAALVIILILPYSRQQPVFLFFEVAVALATWLGGWKAGVVSLVGTTIALAYLEQQVISTPTVLRLILNLVFAAGIIWVVAKLRFSQEALRQNEQGFRRLNAELEQRVAERTKQLQMANQELLREIADRTQVEKALRRSEAYLAEAQRLSHTGSWVWNVAAREYIHWSHEIYRLYGFDPEGGIPSFEAFLEPIHPEDRSRFVDDLERAIRDRADHETVFQTVLLGEAIKHIHEKSHPVLNASGDVIEFVGTAMDITERKSADGAAGARLHCR